MEMALIFLLLVGGGLAISFGASFFVQAASVFAGRMGISPVIIGLTIVSFGTSAPELVVNALAALQGNTDIAIGNVVGSNIFNVAVILGSCGLIAPLFISSQLIRLDIPIMVGSSLLVCFFSQNGTISTSEGLWLSSGMLAYIILQVKLGLRHKNRTLELEVKEQLIASGHPAKDLLLLLAGLLLLVFGADYFVEGAVRGARFLGWSEAVIALTIISAGTSLPEAATSIAATLKGERDIAMGNVIGSNVFNTLGVLGVSSLISGKGLPVSPHMSRIDIPMMVAFCAICLPLAFIRGKIERLPGAMLLTGWLAYTWYLVGLSS